MTPCRRASERTAQLLFQAALREGMFSACSVESGERGVTVRGLGAELTLEGYRAGADDRFFLKPGRLALTFGEFMERLGVLVGGKGTESWARLEEEMTQARETQAVCYSLCGNRPEPVSYLDFEAWTPEGHNLHPGAKTRSEFTSEDQFRYAPELASHVDLPWISVDRSLLETSGEIGEAFRQDRNSWALPVHPWQRENVLPRVYRREWAVGLIRDLDREPIRCRLCTSLRTVVPEDPAFPVLKTSVGCLMTSTDRSMSRFTVHQGPVYSEYIRRIFQERPHFAERVTPLQELGGFCALPSDDPARARNLSLLFRRRPPVVEEGVAVPCSTLPQPAWKGEQTYFGGFFGRGGDPRRHFRSYLELLIPFHLELYLDFGLALEAHMQNCVMEWTQAGPKRLWVRDWGGLRADASRLKEKAPDLLRRLSSESVSLSSAVTAEKKLLACLYCNHLTEVVAGVARAFSLEETPLWEEVYRVTQACFTGRPPTNLEKRLLRDDWPVKCLLKMRLGLGGSGDVYGTRSNPLSQFT